MKALRNIVLIQLFAALSLNAGITVNFNGARLHKEIKLLLFINDVHIGTLSKGMCLKLNVGESNGPLVITSQALNMIDAYAGPACQLELKVEKGKTYNLVAAYQTGNHLTVSDESPECVSVIDKELKNVSTKQAPSNFKYKVHFMSPDMSKELKISLEINGRKLPYVISKGIDLVFQTSNPSLKVVTQTYNMIDAIAGPPFQIIIDLTEAEVYYFANHSKKGHLVKADPLELEKKRKKIVSEVIFQDN